MSVDSTPPATPPEDRAGMLVGIDGSRGALRALEWAVARIDRFGPVQPLAAWDYPWWAQSAPVPPPIDQFRRSAVDDVEKSIET
ncbi:MAG: hypothetical protein ACR2QK_03895, partial [Acidimicrobiales bacterium]